MCIRDSLTAKHNLQHDRQLMERILGEVVALENKGYQFEAAGLLSLIHI